MFSPEEQSRIQDVKVGIQLAVEAAFQELQGQDASRALEDMIRSKFVVSGGISASIFTRTPIKDIDLYYRESVVVDDLNKELHGLFAEGGMFAHFVKEINPEYNVGVVAGKLITVNAITLKNGMQIIKLAGIKECQEIFDFKHCLPVYDLKDKIYKISRNSFDALTNKKLMIHHNSATKPHRVDKFRQRGWDF
jgi:hypothetical protein